VLDSLPSNLNSYTDTAQLTGNVWYFIEAKHPQGCSATLANLKAKNFEKSRSNYANKLGTTSINHQYSIPRDQLKIYPNPYTGKTNIRYIVHKKAKVSLEIFNLIGKKVHTLVNETQLPNTYQYTFSAKDLRLAQGVYILRATIGNDTYTKKLLEY